jgi:hypothetical protein
MYGDFTPITAESVTYGPVERARVKVEKAERILERLPQADCPVTHHFAPGVYMRELTIPQGVLLTGAVHKTEHLSVLSKGHIYILNGEDRMELIAPATVLSPKGVKRAIYAVEDSTWMTIHATTETNTAKLVEELTTSTEEELAGGSANRQLLRSGPQPQIRG